MAGIKNKELDKEYGLLWRNSSKCRKNPNRYKIECDNIKKNLSNIRNIIGKKISEKNSEIKNLSYEDFTFSQSLQYEIPHNVNMNIGWKCLGDIKRCPRVFKKKLIVNEKKTEELYTNHLKFYPDNESSKKTLEETKKLIKELQE